MHPGHRPGFLANVKHVKQILMFPFGSGCDVCLWIIMQLKNRSVPTSQSTGWCFQFKCDNWKVILFYITLLTSLSASELQHDAISTMPAVTVLKHKWWTMLFLCVLGQAKWFQSNEMLTLENKKHLIDEHEKCVFSLEHDGKNYPRIGGVLWYCGFMKIHELKTCAFNASS